MKHLRVLEEAGLVTTQRRGREKLHFLNPVPIRLVHDRWVSKYAEPWAATLTGLKNDWRTSMEKHEAASTRTVATTTACSRSTSRRRRSGSGRRSPTPSMRGRVQLRRRGPSRTGRPARRYRRRPSPASIDIAAGENLEVDPPRRLVQSFNALWSDEVKARGDLAGDLGDRAGRRLLPADRHPRPAARGRATASSTAAGR